MEPDMQTTDTADAEPVRIADEIMSDADVKRISNDILDRHIDLFRSLAK